MKTPSDPEQSIGLGKKVEPRPVITPDWKAIPGRQYHYVHTKTGQRKYAPPVPDTPQYPPSSGGAWEVWAEYIRKQMQGAAWDS